MSLIVAIGSQQIVSLLIDDPFVIVQRLDSRDNSAYAAYDTAFLLAWAAALD
jgi:hypothetical protein